MPPSDQLQQCRINGTSLGNFEPWCFAMLAKHNFLCQSCVQEEVWMCSGINGRFFLVVSVFFHCVSEILAENNLKYRLQNKREFTILPKQNQKVTIFHLCTLQLLLSVLY